MGIVQIRTELSTSPNSAEYPRPNATVPLIPGLEAPTVEDVADGAAFVALPMPPPLLTFAAAVTDAKPEEALPDIEDGGESGGTTVVPLMLRGAEVELAGGVELGAPRGNREAGMGGTRYLKTNSPARRERTSPTQPSKSSLTSLCRHRALTLDEKDGLQGSRVDLTSQRRVRENTRFIRAALGVRAPGRAGFGRKSVTRASRWRERRRKVKEQQ
ncbi:hypothetical protein C8R45DRAFT_1166499 [Mycena sanguinolenta]|nr:hypothetical protein C8R45DRAFT_1166499 [Mycena sanguinolenta]